MKTFLVKSLGLPQFFTLCNITVDTNSTVIILLVICTYDFAWVIQLKSSIVPVVLSCSSFITDTDSHDS